MKKFLTILAILLTTDVALATTKAMDTPWGVTYSDGSGNGFRFWQDTPGAEARFEYSPVLPEQSSTGLYHGGDPKQGELGKKDMKELWIWVRKLEADTSLHVKDRMKGTGAFLVKDARGIREFIIADSPSLEKFNDFVAKFRGSKPRLLSPEQAHGHFPLFPGAVRDPSQGGASSINPGRNFSLEVYTTPKPLLEVLSFYEKHLKGYQKSDEPGGSVILKRQDGSVRLTESGTQTQIKITRGPY